MTAGQLQRHQPPILQHPRTTPHLRRFSGSRRDWNRLLGRFCPDKCSRLSSVFRKLRRSLETMQGRHAPPPASDTPRPRTVSGIAPRLSPPAAAQVEICGSWSQFKARHPLSRCACGARSAPYSPPNRANPLRPSPPPSPRDLLPAPRSRQESGGGLGR